ncbi:lysophospholipid acyltransferase family protein [Rhodocyclus tenuis]|uniref:1-acyl-sn-glycerol-3-phosphate acyltransferase n=1 Tax=Rhodocyclus tenuis TaxID=1066 RepID=A0A840G1I6_RHOTE|nr:lysophospholipid acyltransferase family protein [Rhodocyclus tenuis]MBB4245805.1 1-acyl-sn-glycerol-3-phosphate acyltransferase [Rhodocyclus tenuis]MBK1680605.1 1-acyl-sn-glycerol-3-phosphate acyltransferase [Rhodocyclus tenuis]
MRVGSGLLFRIGQIFLFYLLLLWLAVMLLAGNIAALPLLLTPRAFREPLMQRAISATFRLFLDVSERSGLMVLDLGALDVLNRQRKMLLVANHPSMIDVFLIISRVRSAICLMKASISSNIFLGVGAYMAGYVSNRHVSFMLRNAATAVEKGSLLLAFPEGTRTTRQPVNDMKPGVALIAKRANAPLQTILISTNSPYLSKGWKIWRAPQFPLIYRARLGQQLRACDCPAKTANTVQSYFEQELAYSIDPRMRA